MRRVGRTSKLLAGAALLAALLAACVKDHDLAGPGADEPAADGPDAGPAGRAEAWLERGEGGIRGITVGPIESLRHPGVGYGSPAYERTLDEAARIGATWVSLTPFGRAWDLAADGHRSRPSRRRSRRTAAPCSPPSRQAHARGLKVMLVPHLWVETGEWRALIDPGDDAALGALDRRATARSCSPGPRWRARAASRCSAWASSSRSWVTTPRAASMLALDRRGAPRLPGPAHLLGELGRRRTTR